MTGPRPGGGPSRCPQESPSPCHTLSSPLLSPEQGRLVARPATRPQKARACLRPARYRRQSGSGETRPGQVCEAALLFTAEVDRFSARRPDVPDRGVGRAGSLCGWEGNPGVPSFSRCWRSPGFAGLWRYHPNLSCRLSGDWEPAGSARVGAGPARLGRDRTTLPHGWLGVR